MQHLPRQQQQPPPLKVVKPSRAAEESFLRLRLITPDHARKGKEFDQPLST
jgi:hypothetical protein